MNVEDILNQIDTFKAEHENLSWDITVEHIKDLDDFFGEIYVTAANDSDEIVADTLLMSIEKPTKEDLQELEAIAAALKTRL